MRGLIAVAAAGVLALAPYQPASSTHGLRDETTPDGTGLAPAPTLEVTVSGEGGQTLWALPARLGASLTLAYVNSIYLAPTEEILAVTRDGFTLTAVRSTSEAVLAYNGLPSPYRRDGAFLVAPAARHVRQIVLRVGHTGRPRLRLGNEELPLYTAGEGARLTIAVGNSPRR